LIDWLLIQINRNPARPNATADRNREVSGSRSLKNLPSAIASVHERVMSGNSLIEQKAWTPNPK
jgi:hypothetical protein